MLGWWHRWYIDRRVKGEQKYPSRLFWLSFVDPDLPPESRFLGVAIVRAHGVVTAVRESVRRGCNPGGEVACIPLDQDAEAFIPAIALHRLLDREEAEAIDLLAKSYEPGDEVFPPAAG